MPDKPSAGQTREDYMSSCVPKIKGEGRSGKKAREICFAVWMQYRGKKKKGKKK